MVVLLPTSWSILSVLDAISSHLVRAVPSVLLVPPCYPSGTICWQFESAKKSSILRTINKYDRVMICINDVPVPFNEEDWSFAIKTLRSVFHIALLCKNFLLDNCLVFEAQL